MTKEIQGLDGIHKGRTATYMLIKGSVSLLGGILGYLAGFSLFQRGAFEAINMLYMALLGLLLAYLLSAPLARWLERQWHLLIRRISTIPPQAVLAAGVGTTVALIITVLLNTLLESVPGFTWYWSLLITLVLVTASSWFFVSNRSLFQFSQARAVPAVVTPTSEVGKRKVLDTSVIIDGRLLEVVEANFIEGELLIPRFVLLELQNIADSSDPLRRTRGRRGLEVLDKLIQQQKLTATIVQEDVAQLSEVDEKLVHLCQSLGAALMTTDYNLNRVASLQGVKVLNVNQLANAMRPAFLPGERLSLHIVKQGREQGQGLAYLEDGTMVVVEDAVDLVGRTVDVAVTSHLQTNMGRMIFARPFQ